MKIFHLFQTFESDDAAYHGFIKKFSSEYFIKTDAK